MTRAVPEPSWPNRLRRACLTVPASNERALAKAPTLAVDMVLVDLEDSVPAARKNGETRARTGVSLAASGALASTLALRVNAVSTGWWVDDVRVVLEEAGERLDCIVVPNVEAVEEVRQVDRLLSRLEASLGLASGSGSRPRSSRREGWSRSSESPRRRTASRRSSSGPGTTPPRSASSALDRRIRPCLSRRPVALRAIPNCGRCTRVRPAAHRRPIRRDRRRRRVARIGARARLVGFQGKWAVHPAQIEPLNEVFSPSDEEVDHAVGTLAALDEASEHGERGAALVDGATVDEASRRLAEAVVRRARAVGMDV